MNNSKAVIVVGKIVGAAGQFVLPDGTTGYTTSSVSYSIDFTSDGGGVVSLTGQIPEIRLWGGDQVIDAEALIGSSCVGVVIGGELRWHFVEPPSLGACGPGSQAARVSPDDPRGIVGIRPRGPTLPPVDGVPSTGFAGGGTGASGTGGGGEGGIT